MIVFRYDDTFEGVLSAVFDAFNLKKWPQHILTSSDILPLFCTEEFYVQTTDEKFNRVSQAMTKRLPSIALNQISYVWFSQQPERAILIFNYLVKVFKVKHDISHNFADPDILAIRNLAKKVAHERHYLMMFVRFNAINNQGEKIYFASVEPRYNILPFVLDFFKDRFADQKWVLFDSVRQYGYFYDLKHVQIIHLDEHDDFMINGQINDNYLNEDERRFQKMWHRYCQATTIKERVNPKLQKKSMPVRFWKNLPETWHEDP
ncbi:TIGR03915 family putative DNA repair protein [Orbus mooreae]|uniref:TIGR03915 family putative DNA repair protein n=1 Tax=Orbus mooreae TaxID=3074107 RepID=UPI00370D3682